MSTTPPLADVPISAADKGLPERALGMSVGAFLATAPRLGEFWTPLVVLDDDAIRHNIATMARWCAANALELMPHGKTTMAPELWQRQLDAGARGITLATMGQVRAARAVGVPSILLANPVVDERALRYLAAELRDPRLRFTCWADDEATVDIMERTLARTAMPRPLDVCVELGAEGGRTGARSVDEGARIAARIARSPVLRLAGVGGYEGSLAHGGRSAVETAAVTDYLRAQLELHRRIEPLYDDGDVLVTAGGSAYFDLVAEVYREAPGRTQGGGRTLRTLRSGAYLVHDDGFYRLASPFDGAARAPGGPRLRSAMHGIARVVSRPERNLALLDGGKRDFSYDEGLPIPRALAPELGQPWTPVEDAEIAAVNDQHAYLRTTGSTAASIGSVVRLGLSHPCTVFDKWRLLPLVRSAGSDEVVGLIRTLF